MESRDDSEVSQAFESAPKAIQDALSDGIAIDFIVKAQERYDLHVDVAGKVIERIRDLMLGLANPTEFLGELITLGMSDTVARKLVADLNVEVFAPLKDTVRENSRSTAPQPIQSAPNRKANESPTLPGSDIPAPMHASPSLPSPTPAPSQPSAVIAPVQNIALSQGEVAHPPPHGWHPAAALHIYVPTQAPTSPAAFSTAPPSPPAEVRHVVLDHHPIPATPSIPQEVSATSMNTPGNDPYRESLV